MKAIIFDMDGLMFDTNKVFQEAWDYAGEKMGLGKAGYMTAKTLGMSITAARDIWVGEFGRQYDEDRLKSLTGDFLRAYYRENSAPMKPGLMELLSYGERQGFKLAVASSAPEWEVENHLEKAGIGRYFDAVVHGGLVTSSKPHPEIYIKACSLLGEKPLDCIALEDSKNGILSASSAECKAIMVPDIWQPDDEIQGKAYRIFGDLLQVKDFLECTQ